MSISRIAVEPAVAGAVLWVVLPACLGSLAFGAIEHVFVFMPLVAVPLAMRVLSSLASADTESDPYRLARAVQPVGATLAVGSLVVEKGSLAALLASGWLLTTILLGAGGIRWASSSRPRLNVIAAHVFLPVGAGWLVLSRAGLAPRQLAPLTVFLAAVHFHASGFILQVLIAATARKLERASRGIRTAHSCLSVGTVAGILAIAAGNLAGARGLKFAGVAAVVGSTLALAVVIASLAVTFRSPIARGLLRVSSLALGAAMLIAGMYGVGELVGIDWIGVDRMVAAHGLVNALGFFSCALVAFRFEARCVDSRQPGDVTSAVTP